MAGIYIHIPFCKQACFYCDFHFSTSLKKKSAMIHCIAKELQLRSDELKKEEITTIYFGGGTPSLLNITELNLLFQTIYKNYKVSQNPEITIEINPDDIQINKGVSDTFKNYKNIGINRLSIGIQSFFDDDLKKMNRAHNSKQAIECLEIATNNFDNITIDLIYGIQEMSVNKWKKNLHTAFDFNINHISSYALTVEPNTALSSFIKKGRYKNVDDHLAQQHFEILVSETTKQGFIQYEISNFGKPNYFSKHNTSYWKGEKYIGIGPSAHSYNQTHRSWNIANNNKYIKAIQENKLPSEYEILTKNNQFNEYIMTGLRTIWGVSLHKIESDFGEKFHTILLKQAKKIIDQGLLTLNDEGFLKTTEKGKFLADGIASELFIVN